MQAGIPRLLFKPQWMILNGHSLSIIQNHIVYNTGVCIYRLRAFCSYFLRVFILADFCTYSVAFVLSLSRKAFNKYFIII